MSWPLVNVPAAPSQCCACCVYVYVYVCYICVCACVCRFGHRCGALCARASARAERPGAAARAPADLGGARCSGSAFLPCCWSVGRSVARSALFLLLSAAGRSFCLLCSLLAWRRLRSLSVVASARAALILQSWDPQAFRHLCEDYADLLDDLHALRCALGAAAPGGSSAELSADSVGVQCFLRTFQHLACSTAPRAAGAAACAFPCCGVGSYTAPCSHEPAALILDLSGPSMVCATPLCVPARTCVCNTLRVWWRW